MMLRRSLLLLLMAVLACACARGTRGDTLLFSLEDPRGDDHGDGELRYPLRRDDLQPGALDVLSLRAYAESGGTRFEATFAQPIPRPPRRTVDVTGATVVDMARHGFYTLNLDVYVDMDRAEGSGRTDTMPGRNLVLAPGSAWERALVLTPRPFEARELLRKLWRERARLEAQRVQGSLGESAVRALDEQVERQLAAQVFFPTRIRVVGATVSFFVPEAFLGGQARATWGYAVAVTGATMDRRVEMPAFLGGVTAPPPPGMMVMGIGPGVFPDRFGGGRLGDPGQSPVVDLLVPEGVSQREVLGPKAPAWPAVVPASPALPQAPDAGGPSGQGDAPAPVPPQG
jgi:hypothetical protein